MSAQLSPTLALYVNDTIPSTKTATVSLPTGVFALVSIAVVASDATLQVAVQNNEGTVMRAAIAAGVTTPVAFQATSPAVTTTGTIKIVATVAGNITSAVLTLRAAGGAVVSRTVTVA